MKVELERSKHSNPVSANPGTGSPMTPSPTSSPLKGGVNHGDSPESTTRKTNSITGEGHDSLKTGDE